MWIPLVSCLVLSLSCCLIEANDVTEVIRMPNVSASYVSPSQWNTDATFMQDDAYLCHAKRFGDDVKFITHLKPLDTAVTHHMILFVCDEPGSNEPYWDCGEKEYSKPVCKAGERSVLYSWAMKAAEFSLPKDTSFPIGGKKSPYLVLQVHYKDASGFKNLPNGLDNSGWLISMTTTPTKNVAGIYSFVADGYVGKGETELVLACPYTGTTTIHPFAFRVHAHSHGIMNSASVTHEGETFEIGAMSPQADQTYYPVENRTLEIHPGDDLMARCKMVNNENRLIPIGSTRKDEMCNFYIMYSVPLKHMSELYQPESNTCFQSNAITQFDEAPRFETPLYPPFDVLPQLDDDGDDFGEMKF